MTSWMFHDFARPTEPQHRVWGSWKRNSWDPQERLDQKIVCQGATFFLLFSSIKSFLNGVHLGTLICISRFLKKNKKLLPAPGIESARKAYQRYQSCRSNRLFHFLEERGVQSFVVSSRCCSEFLLEETVGGHQNCASTQLIHQFLARYGQPPQMIFSYFISSQQV